MKKLLIGAAILIAAFFVIPEESKIEIAHHTKIEKYNSRVAKFLISTKVGRKVAYIFIRKKTKKKIKQTKKELKKYMKELEESF